MSGTVDAHWELHVPLQQAKQAKTTLEQLRLRCRKRPITRHTDTCGLSKPPRTMAAIPLLTAAPLITWLQLGILRQHDPSSQELAAIKVYCLGPQPDQPSSHEDLLVPLEWYAPNSLVHFIQRDAQPLLASVPRTELTLDQLMAWVATERKQTDIASLLRQITAHIFARLVPNPECSCECLVTHLPLKWEQYHQFVLFPPSAFQGDPWATFFAQPIADQALTINSSKTISTGTLSTPAALAYFALIACAFRATHLAAKASIPVGDVMRRPIIVPLYGPWGRAWQKCQRYLSPQHQSEPVSSPIHAKPTTDTFWASTRQNGVEYRWAPLHTMFCAGNITEKLRVATSPWFRVGGGTVVDLYAGVGYFTLPYLVHAGAARVHACELNPWSVQGLCHGAKANGIAYHIISLASDLGSETAPPVPLASSLSPTTAPLQIYAGDNALAVAYFENTAQHVNLGLLPSSEQGWPLAVRALHPQGGFLHVHTNARADQITDWIDHTLIPSLHRLLLRWKVRSATATDALTTGATDTDPWRVEAKHVERVKSYAPAVYHYVIDVQCSRMRM